MTRIGRQPSTACSGHVDANDAPGRCCDNPSGNRCAQVPVPRKDEPHRPLLVLPWRQPRGSKLRRLTLSDVLLRAARDAPGCMAGGAGSAD
jgi:hypothetical protein